MTLLQPVGYDRPMPVAPGITAEFINAGHLLGSGYARVHLETIGKTLLFGGDLGRYGRPVLPDPTPVAEADVVLVESTYGNRVHEPDDDGARLAEIINEHGRARRQGDHSGVRARPRRGAALLDRPARGASSAFRSCRSTSTARWRPQCWPSTASASTSSIPRSAATPRPMTPHGRAERRLCAFCTAKLKVVVVDPGIAGGAGIEAARRSSSRRAAWPPAAACCIIWRTRCRTRATRCSSPATRPRARAAVSSWTARSSRASTARTCRWRREIDAIDSMSAHADANEILRWLQRLHAAAGADVPRARRARTDGRAQSAHRARAGLDREDAAASGEDSTSAMTRRYLLEQVDDAAVVQYYADGFDRAAARSEDPRLASVPGRARRPRHLLRPALPPRPRHARGARGDLLHARAGDRRRARRRRRDPPLHEAVLDQLRSAQQHDGAQVRAAAARRTSLRGRRAARRRSGARFPLRRGRDARRAARPAATAPFFDPAVDRAGHEQDARRRPRHPRGERQQPLRRRDDGRPRRASRSGSA